MATAEYSSAASGSPYSASRRDKAPARWVSLVRLPLSRAITRPRRRASRARAGSSPRQAYPYSRSANEIAYGLRVASADSIRPFAVAIANGLIESAEATRNPYAISFALLEYAYACRGRD